MCHCTPEIRTPFCGKPNCKWPEPPKENVHDAYIHGQAMQIVMEMERAFERHRDVQTCLRVTPANREDVKRLCREFEDVWLDQMKPILENLKKHIRPT